MMEDPQSVVTEINGCISQASKRQHGLLKLAVFLENCQFQEQITVLEKTATFWIKTLLQIFESHPVTIHAKLAHYCFSLLIQCSRNASPELARTIGSHFIEKSVTILTQSNDQLAKTALICINEMILNYRGACSQHKQKIETFVLSKLDSESDEVVEWASKCYSKLPYLHKNQANTDMWYAYFKNMIRNANTIINDIYEEHQPGVQMNAQVDDSEFIKNHTGHNQQAEAAATTSLNMFLNKTEKIFGKLEKENLEMYYQKLCKRFRACCLSLSYMFEPLNESVIVKIRSAEIIDFLKRLYFFEFKKLNMSRGNLETKYLMEIISDIYNETLKFTIKFFQILNTNLLTNSNQISHMLVHFGSNLKENILFNSIPLYYNCLREWIQNVGSNSGLNKYSSGVIDVLLANIKPFQKNTLRLETAKYSKPKEPIRNQSDSGLFFSDKLIVNSYQIQNRKKTICAALDFLSYYIRNFCYKFNYNHLEKIQQTIINIFLCIQNNITSQKPYDQADCRLSLYKILHELCHAQNTKLAPPLSISIALFQTALDDASNEIKSFAQQTISTLRAYACPIMPLQIREFQVTRPEVSKQEPIVQTTKSMLTITKNLENTKQFQQTPSINILPICHSTAKIFSERNEITSIESDCRLNFIKEKSIDSLINNSINTEQRPNSLTDMKNTLNIQLSEKQVSMKRKSPINEEEYVKNDLKRPMKFVSNLNGNYTKNSHLKENGGGDSNGIDGNESEELEIIDSEIDEEDMDEDDDEEFDDEDEYEDEEDIDEEIDLEDEDDMDAENGKTLTSIDEQQTQSQSLSQNGQITSQSNDRTDLKTVNIDTLLKECGDYDSEEDEENEEHEEDEDDENQSGSEIIMDDDDDEVYNVDSDEDVSNEDKTDTIKVSQSEQPSTSEITPSPEPLVASNEVLALEIEKTTIGIIKSDTTETTEVETVQIAVVNEVPIVEDEAQNAEQDLINISAVAAESSQTNTVELVMENIENTPRTVQIEIADATITESEACVQNKENTVIIEESQPKSEDSSNKSDAVVMEQVAPVVDEQEVEKACADFKVDAVTAENYETSTSISTEKQ